MSAQIIQFEDYRRVKRVAPVITTQEGREAFRSGLGWNQNPYSPGSFEHTCWANGWVEAMDFASR